MTEKSEAEVELDALEASFNDRVKKAEEFNNQFDWEDDSQTADNGEIDYQEVLASQDAVEDAIDEARKKQFDEESMMIVRSANDDHESSVTQFMEPKN